MIQLNPRADVNSGPQNQTSLTSFRDKHVFLFGPPGAGKGTLSEFLKQRQNYFHLGLGDILKDEVKNRTPIGLQVKPLLDKGLLVPSEIGFSLFEKYFLTAVKANKLVLIDGMLQSEAYVDFFTQFMMRYSLEDRCCLVFLRVNKEVAKNRICNRIICNSCKRIYTKQKDLIHCEDCKTELITRTDDCFEQAVTKRLDRFFQVTAIMPAINRLIEQFKARSLYLEIDAERDLESLKKEYREIFG